MTATPHEDQPVLRDPEQQDPRADSLRAAETPAQPDAERMEAALREQGPFQDASGGEEQRERALREQPTEDGPGTSLT